MRGPPVIGFISGHNHLLRTQRKVYNNPYMDVTCRACEEPGTTEDASHLWSKCKALRHIKSIVHELPEANDESDAHIESNQRTFLAAFSSGTDRQTLESPFEWVPSQLSRFLTDPTSIRGNIKLCCPMSQMGTLSVPRANCC